jgi:hypothetical protein
MMKVIDLIQLLEKFDPSLLVMVPGYEGGYGTVDGVVEPRTFVENVNCAWYYGPHDLDNQFLDQELHGSKPRFEAITIY